MIQFKEDTELTIITGFDEETDNITDETIKVFKANENIDADIYNEDGNYVDIQFGDGSIATSVLREDFNII